jgi:hypothetical protein
MISIGTNCLQNDKQIPPLLDDLKKQNFGLELAVLETL